jgi:hypothetical protein
MAEPTPPLLSAPRPHHRTTQHRRASAVDQSRPAALGSGEAAMANPASEERLEVQAKQNQLG